MNCNADTAAGAIAGALKANRLLLLTDVKGVLNKDMELIEVCELVASSSLNILLTSTSYIICY